VKYPEVLRVPFRRDTAPYKGVFTITFENHNMAHSALIAFSSHEGIVWHGRRLTASWGTYYSHKKIQVRKNINFLRNLISENRLLRAHAPADYKSSTKESGPQQPMLKLTSVDPVSPLEKYRQTRTVSPFLSKLSGTELQNLKKKLAEEMKELEQKQKNEKRELKGLQLNYMKLLVGDAYRRNYRDRDKTAEELGLKDFQIARLISRRRIRKKDKNRDESALKQRELAESDQLEQEEIEGESVDDESKDREPSAVVDVTGDEITVKTNEERGGDEATRDKESGEKTDHDPEEASSRTTQKQNE